jgi:hypothetical protein
MKYTRKRKRKRRRTKLRGGDVRHSILPTPLSDIVTSTQDFFTRTASTFSGSYPGVDPSWRIQPLR